jgi:uncharacterized protein
MARTDTKSLASIFLLYAGAIATGYVVSWLGVPLPWMIGPMICAGLVSALGKSIPVPVITRLVGQTVVAAAVGLSFTPAAVIAVAEQIVPMVAVALLTILSGFVVAGLLVRLTHIDIVSASLASVPGGPVEMAALATRYGVSPGPVAFAQTMRIALLVLIIPPLLVGVTGGTADASAVLGGEVDLLGTGLLLAIATAGGLVFRLVRMTSPFFLGALGFSAAAAALSLPVSLPPYVILASAQVLLGVWLGRMFDRKLLFRSRSFIPAALFSTLVLMVLCAGMAFAVSALTGIDWQIMVLATAPGSVTEMALTAKILNKGVAMVTAFHVVRIFIILPAAPLIFAITARLAGRASSAAKDRP